MPDLAYRSAKPADARAVLELISRYSSRGQLLPRTYAQVMERIRDFNVAIEGEVVLGCAGLHPVGEDLAEIRSLAVTEERIGNGLGRALVESCLKDAARLGVKRVFALTYQTGFFGKMGFTTVEKLTLPRKVWGDCVHCAKFSDCDEVAVLKTLEDP